MIVDVQVDKEITSQNTTASFSVAVRNPISVLMYVTTFHIHHSNFLGTKNTSHPNAHRIISE